MLNALGLGAKVPGRPDGRRSTFGPNGLSFEPARLVVEVAQLVVHESDEPHLLVDLWLCGSRQVSSFPVAKQALNAYVVTEVEAPHLVANTQRITVDCHVLAPDVE